MSQKPAKGKPCARAFQAVSPGLVAGTGVRVAREQGRWRESRIGTARPTAIIERMRVVLVRPAPRHERAGCAKRDHEKSRAERAGTRENPRSWRRFVGPGGTVMGPRSISRHLRVFIRSPGWVRTPGGARNPVLHLPRFQPAPLCSGRDRFSAPPDVRYAHRISVRRSRPAVDLLGRGRCTRASHRRRGPGWTFR